MDEIVKQIFQQYGPTAIPWVLAGVLAFFLWKERYSTKEVIQPYHDFIQSYRDLVEVCHEAIKENTKVTERLAILIEERTRRQQNDRRS